MLKRISLLTALSALSCAEATGPARQAMTPPQARLAYSPSSTGVVVPASYGFAYGGTTFQYLTLVHLSYSGSGGATAVDPNSVPQGLSWGPQGYEDPYTHNCWAAPTFNSTYGDPAGQSCSTTGLNTYVYVKGSIWGSTGGLPGGPWNRSGNITITVDRVDVAIGMTVNKPAILPTDSATFTTTFSPDSVVSRRVPRDVYYWFARDDDGSETQNPCSNTLHTCVYKPDSSGVMWYGGVVNGQYDRVGRHVDVVPCLRADSTDTLTAVLNSSSVRKALNNIWSESNPGATDPADRKEQGAAIYIDPETGRIFAETDIRDTNTPCHSDIVISTNANRVLLATVHTHPYHVDESVPPKTSSNGCPTGNNNVYRPDSPSSPLSDTDWDQTDTSPPHAVYAIDYDRMFRGGPGTPKAQREENSSQRPRSTNSCGLY